MTKCHFFKQILSNLIVNLAKKARVFVHVKFLQASLAFVNKATGTATSVTALFPNLRLAQNSNTGTNYNG
jgi:hypothetical protein